MVFTPMMVETFVRAYLAAEYELWALAHHEPNQQRFEQAVETFEKAYFGPGLYSCVGRPPQLAGERFEQFRRLLADKQPRPFFGATVAPDGVGLAVVGSEDRGSTSRFELLRVREVAGRLRIVSTYLTEFDGTFSWSGGENVGESLPDPLLPA